MKTMRIAVTFLILGLCAFGFGAASAQGVSAKTKLTGTELVYGYDQAAAAAINEQIRVQNQANFRQSLQEVYHNDTREVRPGDYCSTVAIPQSAMLPSRYRQGNESFNVNILPSTYPGSPMYFNKAYKSKPLTVPFQIARAGI